MNPSDFQPNSPGKLVRTTGWVRRLRNGTPETVPVPGWAFVPDPLPPQIDRDQFIGRVSEELLAAQSELSKLEGTVGSLPSPELLLRPFRLREAKLSSRIENTVASVEEVALAAAGRAPQRDEVSEVRNYVDALEHGLSSDWPLGNRLFCEMHEILLRNVRGDDKRPGQFRDGQVYIGDDTRGFTAARFVPPPPGEPLLRCMRDYEQFLNPDAYANSDRPTRTRYPRLIEIAMAHYQFEAIHPFNDGNGRLGRLIVAISLCRDGLLARPIVYVSAYFERNRQRYYDLLLRVSTHGDWESWTRFFCEAVAAEARDAIVRAGRLRNLRQRYLDAVTSKRASALTPRLIDYLFVQPAVRTSHVAEHLGISTPAAQGHINKLVEKNILQEATGSNYGRIYVARGILGAVEDDAPADRTDD